MAASQDKTVVDQARGDKGLNYGQKEIDKLKKYLQAKTGRAQHWLRCGSEEEGGIKNVLRPHRPTSR